MKNHNIKTNSKEFFEGWYFKHQNADETISFIPGIHICKNKKPFAFIQIITNNKSHFIKYPYNAFYAKKNTLYIRIGNNVFSKDGIFININTPQFTAKGKIKYGKFTPIKYDIMGPFSILSNMQCNHGIVSLNHNIKGYLKINNKLLNFNTGKGYIEKDWGSSFPETYTWIQSNDFKDKTSVVVSTADIPFCNFSFQGLIAIVYYKGKEYRFASYNGAKILNSNENYISIKKGKYYLNINILTKSGYPLKAPHLGDMSRIIYENPSCPAIFSFYKNNKKIFTKLSNNSSFEYVD